MESELQKKSFCVMGDLYGGGGVTMIVNVPKEELDLAEQLKYNHHPSNRNFPFQLRPQLPDVGRTMKVSPPYFFLLVHTKNILIQINILNSLYFLRHFTFFQFRFY